MLMLTMLMLTIKSYANNDYAELIKRNKHVPKSINADYKELIKRNKERVYNIRKKNKRKRKKNKGKGIKRKSKDK